MRSPDRVITPEILDSLDHLDPRAIRSRRDLAVIDAFMGNSRWIVRTIAHNPLARQGIVELGAGSGHLCERLHRILPDSQLTGLDLIPRPATLSNGIHWLAGDFFDTLDSIRGGACVGSLILHHFSHAVLRELGRRLHRFPALVFAEPHRSRIPLAAAGMLSPLVGEVTRHDMPASIRAGFVPGELTAAMQLDSNEWIIRETTTWTGAIRFTAIKQLP